MTNERDAEARPARRRDSSATKEAFLAAAATLFADRGFDRTTVRDIADAAGANQALLFRYFGSKEALFDAAVARNARACLAETPPAELLDSLLRELLEANAGDRPDEAMRAFMLSAGQESRRAELRSQLEKEYTDALATLSDAPDAVLRAHLVLAWLIGIGLVCTLAGDGPLKSADPSAVRGLVTHAAGALLERTAAGTANRRPDQDRAG